jgi:hypothetical protein
VDPEDFKSFCRVLKPSGVGSIPTRSRHILSVREGKSLPFRQRISFVYLAVQMVALVPAADTAGQSVFERRSVLDEPARIDSVRLPLRQDTTESRDAELEWSSRKIKDLIEGETAQPVSENPTWEERKNPTTAMLCALVFPGLGQIYNEKAFKAVIAMGVETFYIMNILHNHRRARDFKKQRDLYDRYVPCGPGDTLTCIDPDWRYNNAWYEEYKERTVDWIWWTSAAVLVVMLDAYVDAHLHDMRFRLESVSGSGAAGLALAVDF